jgi:hypothetical protein
MYEADSLAYPPILALKEIWQRNPVDSELSGDDTRYSHSNEPMEVMPMKRPAYLFVVYLDMLRRTS